MKSKLVALIPNGDASLKIPEPGALKARDDLLTWVPDLRLVCR